MSSLWCPQELPLSPPAAESPFGPEHRPLWPRSVSGSLGVVCEFNGSMQHHLSERSHRRWCLWHKGSEWRCPRRSGQRSGGVGRRESRCMRSDEHSAASILPFICCYRIMAGSFRPSVDANPKRSRWLSERTFREESLPAYRYVQLPPAFPELPQR
jgi:hypothetical protein